MNKKNFNYVYSTNKNIKFSENEEETYNKKITEIHLRKKNGKYIVIIKNLSVNVTELKKISKEIKEQLAIGGTIKKGEIILQGNKRDDIIKILKCMGYKCKKVGG